ncbi:MAG: ATP-binding cassette domain-containing protein [Bacteroidales bacterium]
MAQKKIIEVNQLSAAFGERKILQEVSFQAYEQDITVILGGSGAGKSVLLKHLLGLYLPEPGMVQVLNQDVALLEEENQKAHYLKLGVFYQNGGLLNSLTVGENIALPLEQHTDLADELIAHVVKSKLNLVNLLDAYSLYPSQLSGGMLKRAALARAIILDPYLLFCDEPGAGLDPVSLAALDELILNLREQLGMSIVIITHELSSIMRIADRIVFIDEGKIVFQGTLQEGLNSTVPPLQHFFSTGMQKATK